MMTFSQVSSKRAATSNRRQSHVKTVFRRALKCICFVLCLLALFIASLVLRGPSSSQTMRLISDVRIPGAQTLLAGTDYAIVEGRTLFFAYGTADTIMAVDTQTNSVRIFASRISGVHGVAFSKKANLAFASMGERKWSSRSEDACRLIAASCSCWS